MIKGIIRSEDGTKQMLLLGISAENWKLLMEGKPIAFSVTALGIPNLSEIHTIAMVGGENEQAIIDEVTKHYPVIKDLRSNN